VHFHENLLSSKHYTFFFVSERQNPFLTHIHFEARERKNLIQRQRQKSCKLCVLSDYHCALWVEGSKCSSHLLVYVAIRKNNIVIKEHLNDYHDATYKIGFTNSKLFLE
jgi:hypothetical protein